MFKKRHGFTLIELLVVVIIVAVLAAVGIPLLSGNVDRARASEAEAALGSIRTSMRAVYIQSANTYPAIAANTTPNAAGIGINATDFDGRFFSTSAYTLVSPRGTGTNQTYCAAVDGNVNNNAPRAAQVTAIQRSMNEIGNLWDDASCGAAGGVLLNP